MILRAHRIPNNTEKTAASIVAPIPPNMTTISWNESRSKASRIRGTIFVRILIPKYAIYSGISSRRSDFLSILDFELGALKNISL